MRAWLRTLCLGVVVFAGLPAHADGPLRPANDSFATATPISSIPFVSSDDMTLATPESGEPACGLIGVKSVWYRFTPQADTLIEVFPGRGTQSTALAGVYTGSSLNDLTVVSTCASISRTLKLAGGTTYSILVALNAHDYGVPTFTMNNATGISGTVTADSTGLPLENVYVQAFSFGESFSWGAAVTGTDGTYAITDLKPASDYEVLFYPQDDDHLGEFYDDVVDWQQETLVTVTSHQLTPNIDAGLARAAIISGTITDLASASGVNTCVEAYDSGTGAVAGYDYSTSGGAYRVAVRGTGTYKVKMGCDFGLYLPEWYDNKSDFASADIVSATVGEETGGIDASLVVRPAPVNDNFADAADVASFPYSASTDVTRASMEPGEPSPCGQSQGRTTWYKLTTPAGGVVAVNTRGSTTQTFLDVYTGDSVDGLHKVACNRANTRGSGQISFRATAQTTYYIQLGSSYEGNAKISIDWAAGGGDLPLSATTPCFAACPYWSNPLDSSAEHESACAESPASPPGSWADFAVTVPATVAIGDVEAPPTELVFLASPDIDHDTWICYPGSHTGPKFVATGANTIDDTCAPGPVACDEQVTIPVTPGEQFVLRVYNWSDPNPNPSAWFGYKVAR